MKRKKLLRRLNKLIAELELLRYRLMNPKRDLS